MMRTDTTAKRQSAREGDSLFSAMRVVAWLTLAIGVVLSFINISDFSDNNSSLMTGIGFLVGSVFIFIIGTAINLVHKRNSQNESN